MGIMRDYLYLRKYVSENKYLRTIQNMWTLSPKNTEGMTIL